MEIEEPYERKNRLIRESKVKDKGQDWLDLQCAMWTVEILSKFQWLPIPLKPEAVLNHEMIPAETRRQFGKTYYDDHPDIARYYKLTQQSKVKNLSNLFWLTQCKEILLRNEKSVEASLITARLEEVEPEMLLTVT